MAFSRILLLVASILASTTLSAETVRWLIPVVIDGEIVGAQGSRWTSTITAYNNTNETISYRASVEPCSITCPPDPSLEPGETREVEILPNQSGGGMYLVFDAPTANALVVNARVQDVSRSATTWGTELPVIPENDFREKVVLLSVPTDSRFRSSLRVYGRFADRIDVQLYDQNADSELAQGAMQLSAFGSDPLQAFVADVVEGLGLPKEATVRIVLTPANPQNRIWAFSSVTNNETQHVTLITPQP